MPDLRVLALDCATATGWATNCAGGTESGVQRFPVRYGSSPGMRYVEFRVWLRELIQRLEPDVVVYEQPARMARGMAQRDLSIGLTTRVQELAAEAGAEYKTIYSSSLKLFAVGKGNADKAVMQDLAHERWSHYSPGNDPGGDECDALWMLAWALAGFPEREPEKKARKKAKVG